MLHALADHLADHPDRTPASVQMIATAGEQLRITAPVRDWCRRQPFAIDNQYGPTETHVVAAELLPASDVDRWPDRPAIGRPVDGATLFVTDPAGHLLPDEVAGELLIGGAAPALGYAGDAARTCGDLRLRHLRDLVAHHKVVHCLASARAVPRRVG